MQNEQCGQCWDLKFDKLGNKTHDQKHTHDFIPLDYCLKCKEPQFDSNGNQTHAQGDFDVLHFQNTRENHKFVSVINVKHNEQKRKKENILLYIILASGVVATIFNIPYIFF